MHRIRLMFVLSVIALSATCLGAETWVVRPDGIGPVRIGMKFSELKSKLHLSYSLEMAQDSDQQSCFYADLLDHPGITLMILNSRVGRIDVDDKGTQTTLGAHNGDSEARIRSLYGSRLKVTPHAYIEAGHYLTVRSGDGRNGIRFETDGEKVTLYYAGELEAISYIEGCE